MSDEQINIAIAEACGWTHIFQPDDEFALLGMHPAHSMGRDYSTVPDYCDDLNAMHKAERSVPFNIYDYVGQLAEASGAALYYEDDSEAFQLLSATARQRAEAFLRTLGKWEES